MVESICSLICRLMPCLLYCGRLFHRVVVLSGSGSFWIRQLRSEGLLPMDGQLRSGYLLVAGDFSETKQERERSTSRPALQQYCSSAAHLVRP